MHTIYTISTIPHRIYKTHTVWLGLIFKIYTISHKYKMHNIQYRHSVVGADMSGLEPAAATRKSRLLSD